jgi:phosphoribosylanthranilate isomerase
MGLIVKICGLKDETVLAAALDSGADMVGFVHFPKSPRHLPLSRIGELIRATENRAETTVLLVDPDAATLQQVAALHPDWVQLHGSEAPAGVSAAKSMTGIRLMKALPVVEKSDLRAIPLYSGIADRIMLDAKPPKGATRPGGLGRSFDWSILDGGAANVPFMLAGGLNPANVGRAITRLKPFGVDVSSGVETAPGVKDAGLVRAFVGAARAAEKAGTK